MSQNLRKKYNFLIQEKIEIDEILLRQEEKINQLNSENESFKNQLENKKEKIEQGEKNILNIMKILDKNKKLVNSTKNKLTIMEKDIGENKLSTAEKDQEILYLRNYLKTLKADRNFFIYFIKFF
jgi:hypothetical protein